MTIKYPYNRGSALITALFIMTLISIVATAMLTRLHLEIYRINAIQKHDHLYLASQAVTFWAIDRVADPKQAMKGLDKAGKVLAFPSKLKHLYPNVTLEGSVYDLQAKFNLNNVSDEIYQPVLYGLLEHTLPKSNSEERKFILDAIINWISGSKDIQTGHDEWFDRYSKQEPVYLPSYQPMQDSSELRTVFGIHASLYQTLSPWVTALPEITPINLNTAPLALLMSLGDGMKQQDAEALIKIRLRHELKNLAEIEPILNRFNIPQKEITLQSDYFLSVARATSDDVSFTNYVIINRHKNKQGKLTVRILSEHF